MKKRLILLLLTIIAILNISYAIEQEDFNYINLYLDELGETNKVHYELKYPQNNEYYFEMYTTYNKIKQEKFCVKDIQLEQGTIYSKISCDVLKLGDGEYTFEANFYDKDRKLIKNIINKEYIYENSNTNMQFSVKDNKTTITIRVEGNEPLTITNEIPKSVIEVLTKENQNSLIESNIPYSILKADPLIAWNIEEPPATINYTINKRVSLEEQKQFQLDIKNDKTFQGLKYGIFIIILIILGFLVKPVFKKK